MTTRRSQPLQREVFGITVLSPKHPRMQAITKKGEPTIHGQRPWSSTWLLLDYLERNPMTRMNRVLEAGCGWGYASCYCASKLGASVVALDADERVFPFLLEHAAINHCQSQITTLKAEFQNVPKTILKKTDMIVAADVCFWDELKPLHWKMIQDALSVGVKRIIYADPGRQPFEDLAKQCEKELNATLYDWKIRTPNYADGYILVIEGTKR